MQRNWAGLTPKLFGTLPILPSNPRGLGSQPERIADKRKLIKDETDEALSEIFEHEAHEERCRDSDRLQHPAGSAGLWNPQAPSGGAGTSPAAKLQWSDQLGKLSSARDRQSFSMIRCSRA